MASKQRVRAIEPQRLDTAFYQGFDDSFLFSKATALMATVEEFDAFRPKIFDSGTTSAEIAKFLEALRAEIYFTECHQTEALLALVMAVFQNEPHWIYLTEYEPGAMKSVARRYLDRDIKGLTMGRLDTVAKFLHHAVYSGLVSADTDKRSRWSDNLDNIDWFLRRFASRYLEATEYNAYKHGLRVHTGDTRLAIYPDGQPDKAIAIAQSSDSLTHLEIKRDNGGVRTAHLTTKFFNPKESYTHLFAMRQLLVGSPGTELEFAL